MNPLVVPRAITAGEAGVPLHTWFASLLPYLDQSRLASRFNWSQPWHAPVNQPVMAEVVPVFGPGMLPLPERDAAGFGLSYFAGNADVLAGGIRHLTEFSDGTSNTVLLGEVAENPSPWGRPGNCRDLRKGFNRDPHGFGGKQHLVNHGSPSEIQLLFADGSVRSVRVDIDPKVLEALATPNGGDVVGDF